MGTCNPHNSTCPFVSNKDSNHVYLLFIIPHGKFCYIPKEWEHFITDDIAGIVIQTHVRISHWPEHLFPRSCSSAPVHSMSRLVSSASPSFACFHPMFMSPSFIIIHVCFEFRAGSHMPMLHQALHDGELCSMLHFLVK